MLIADRGKGVPDLELQLKGKVALVTAASAGLGRASALALAQEGAQVAIVSRNQANIEAAAAEIREETGAAALPLVADVADPEAGARLVKAVLGELGRLDILVCNAGGPPPGDFLSVTEEAWLKAFDLTLMSVIRLVRAAVPAMEQAGGGRIVNIASSSVKQPIPGLVISNVYRPALAGLFKHLSAELAPRGILVNTVAPGRIATERVRSLDEAAAKRAGITPAEARQRSEAAIPLGRYGEPHEFGRVVAFLASGSNTYVTGQQILVDGGMIKAI